MEDRFQVIIAGSRDFDDKDFMYEKLDYLFQDRKPTAIISGTARGADRMGEDYARSRGIQVLRFPADWDRHGKRAGYVRNAAMLEAADGLVAFWDGESKGTEHMIRIARGKGIQVRVVKFQGRG